MREAFMAAPISPTIFPMKASSLVMSRAMLHLAERVNLEHLGIGIPKAAAGVKKNPNWADFDGSNLAVIRRNTKTRRHQVHQEDSPGRHGDTEELAADAHGLTRIDMTFGMICLRAWSGQLAAAFRFICA